MGRAESMVATAWAYLLIAVVLQFLLLDTAAGLVEVADTEPFAEEPAYFPQLLLAFLSVVPLIFMWTANRLFLRRLLSFWTRWFDASWAGPRHDMRFMKTRRAIVVVAALVWTVVLVRAFLWPESVVFLELVILVSAPVQTYLIGETLRFTRMGPVETV